MEARNVRFPYKDKDQPEEFKKRKFGGTIIRGGSRGNDFSGSD